MTLLSAHVGLVDRPGGDSEGHGKADGLTD